MVILTFEGNIIPQYITLDLVRFQVEQYIYPVVQCLNCFKFGHTMRQCKATSILCKNCGKDHEDNSSCSNPKYCLHCKTNEHTSLTKQCPAYQHQYNIKKIMAIENTTFKEAEFIAKNPSYAKITTHNQFEVLSNLNNFPQLPSVANDSTGNFSYVPKPKKKY
uniref:Uncharacterized protein LOC114340842 n=1 Tax=Diabrotica virgifera virgifera TaxID=50390 RepID=A0A6P7GQD1_DIAVI